MLSRVLNFIIFVFRSPILIIINGYNGYLVEPENIVQLEKKINQYINLNANLYDLKND